MSSQEARVRWRALESNPEVLTVLIRQIGAPEKFVFHDVFGLDEELLAMVPQPIDEKDPFFLLQVPGLGNACGTIASIHALANSPAAAVIEASSPLGDFIARTRGMTPKQRGMSLLEDEGIRGVHDDVADQGQTGSEGAAGEVDYHFVCFVHASGTLFELDGLKDMPIAHGATTPETLLQDAAKVIRDEFMAARPEMINFAVLALGEEQQ